MKELDHETSKSLEGTGNSDTRADLDEDAFGGVDIDLKLSGLIDRRIEESKETLRNINPAHLLNDCSCQTWWVMSGLASLMSRFILRITPMCSSLFSSEYFSSRGAPGLPPL